MGVGLVHLSPRATGLPRKLVSPAVRHSAPNLHSNGPAVLTDELPPQGHLFKNPDAADRLGQPFRRREPRGCASLPVGRSRTFVLSLTKRPEPGSFAPRDVSKSLPVIGFHVPEHGEADEQDGAKKTARACKCLQLKRSKLFGDLRRATGLASARPRSRRWRANSDGSSPAPGTSPMAAPAASTRSKWMSCAPNSTSCKKAQSSAMRP